MFEIMNGDDRMGFLPHDRHTGIGVAIVQGKAYVPSPYGIKIVLNGGSDLDIILKRVKKQAVRF